MRRGHQHHPRFSGQRKSTVSIDEVIAALRDQEFSDQKEPETPPLTPNSTESQKSSPKFFRDRQSPSNDKVKYRKRRSGNFDDQSGSSVHSSPSNRRRPRSFYDSPGSKPSGDTTVKKSVNDRLHFHQRRSDEELSPPEVEKSSPKKTRSQRKSTKVTPTSRIKTPSESENNPKRHSKKKAVQNEDNEDWSKLRCTSELSEAVAEKEKRRSKKKNADDLETIFAEAVFRSDTLMRLNIIKNELHNIQKSQLRRAENDFSSFNKRIESQESELNSWEKELKVAQGTLIETTALMEKAQKAKDLAVDEIISYDECMNMLEKRLEEIRMESQ